MENELDDDFNAEIQKIVNINELRSEFPVISEVKWSQTIPKPVPKLRDKFQSFKENEKIRQKWYENYTVPSVVIVLQK